jgi:hypothetical protein
MTTIPLPQLTGRELLTHSRLSTYRTCPRKHYIAYELGIRREVDAQPLRMGGAVHLGLELRAKGERIDDAIMHAVIGYEVVPGWAKTEEQIADWLVERVTVQELLRGYFRYWEEGQHAPEITPDVIIESESGYTMPIRNPDTGAVTPLFKAAGKTDKVVTLADGRLAVMEHKTTGDDIDADSDYWKRLRIDSQISGYVKAARHRGHAVETVLYDVLRKPKIAPKQVPLLDKDGIKVVVDPEGNRVYNENGKPRQSADSAKGWTLLSRVETPEEFGERLRADIAERPTFYFARQEIPRLDSDLAEFDEELWQIQQQLREAQKTGRHFRNAAACLMFGKCTYFDICTNGVDASKTVPAGFTRVEDIHPELTSGD